VTIVAAGGQRELDFGDAQVATAELGAQGSLYVLGGFDRGLLVSLELAYLWLDSEVTEGEATGFSIGPLLGAKIALQSGLTFLAQAGLSYLSGDGRLASKVLCERCAPNLNLNVGWTF
jgi:hypothetical protein